MSGCIGRNRESKRVCLSGEGGSGGGGDGGGSSRACFPLVTNRIEVKGDRWSVRGGIREGKGGSVVMAMRSSLC